jgi:23S rRNA (uracil1939-C5)-methyltransferase
LQDKFEIDHIDPLGQGVSKQSDKVCFVRKTLPGETGTTKILKKSKGVTFADPESFDHISPLRIQAQCPHYEQCPSCHFLHTSWDNETSIKKLTLENEIQKRLKNSPLLNNGMPPVQILKDNSRDAYRNRIQLHYDLKKKQLGHIDALHKKIVDVPDCRLPTAAIQTKLKELYKSSNWTEWIPKNSPPKGHVELIEKASGVEVVWNSRYSDGGFTQVNQAMNDSLVALVTEIIQKVKPENGIWDLFGGNGNLTRGAQKIPTLIVDSFQKNPGIRGQHNYIEADLYSSHIIEGLRELSSFSPDLLLIDPPRSGFKQLNNFLNELKPKNCIYVSCHQGTQLRDLHKIEQNYTLKEVHLVELFPSTYHFETVFHLQINDEQR